VKRIILFILPAAAACSPQPTASPRLVNAGASVNCIDLKQVVGRRVLPPSAVLFEMPGRIAYRNEFQGSCPGAARADPSAIIETESQSSELCRDDRVRIYDPVEARATGPRSFAECRLGSFTAVPGD